MATAFQIGAFQIGAFQIDAADLNVAASASQTISIYQIARAKRNKNWPRLGPTPDHDTDYERWRVTKPQRRTT